MSTWVDRMRQQFHEPEVMAELKVHHASEWTDEQCDAVVAWLREKAHDIKRERKIYATHVRMRYYR